MRHAVASVMLLIGFGLATVAGAALAADKDEDRKLKAEPQRLANPAAAPETSTHWSFQAPVHRPVPAVKDKTWPNNPLDHFVLAKLEANDLRPACPADKRTLLRRVTFDLTGLPPTSQEIDAFLADTTA